MTKRRTRIVNFFAGPGTGKSTMAAELFARLKADGVNCELVREFAKDLVWEHNMCGLANQFYVTAMQHHRQRMLDGQVEVMITDSPILLGLLYDSTEEAGLRTAFRTFLLELFAQQDNLNFFLHRSKAYNPVGRVQTEEQAVQLDLRIRDLLTDNQIPFLDAEASRAGGDYVHDIVTLALKDQA